MYYCAPVHAVCFCSCSLGLLMCVHDLSCIIENKKTHTPLNLG